MTASPSLFTPPSLIAFDLDDTLAVTKSPISPLMAQLLGELLCNFQVCIISGGRWEQFESQVIDQLQVPADLLTRLHLMPTSGTRYYLFDASTNQWVQQYAEDLSNEDKQLIVSVLTQGAHTLGLWEASPAGAIIEDRGSQITFSALGQLAPPSAKYAWDPTGVKKRSLREYAALRLPTFDVKAGGSTSVDVTRLGINKAYGMKRLLSLLSLNTDAVVYFGDQLQDGGNDASIRTMGITTVAVRNSDDTECALRAILAVFGQQTNVLAL